MSEQTADVLTEMLVAQVGAVRMPARLVLRPGDMMDNVGRQIGLWGAAICPPELCPLIAPRSERHNEMWIGEIILLPTHKFTSKFSPEKNGYGVAGHAFSGMRAGQMLCGGFSFPQRWGPCYFGVEPVYDEKERDDD